MRPTGFLQFDQGDDERCARGSAAYEWVSVFSAIILQTIAWSSYNDVCSQPADLIAFRMGTLHLLNIEWRVGLVLSLWDVMTTSMRVFCLLQSSDFQFMVDVDFVDFLLESYRGLFSLAGFSSRFEGALS